MMNAGSKKRFAARRRRNRQFDPSRRSRRGSRAVRESVERQADVGRLGNNPRRFASGRTARPTRPRAAGISRDRRRDPGAGGEDRRRLRTPPREDLLARRRPARTSRSNPPISPRSPEPSTISPPRSSVPTSTPRAWKRWRSRRRRGPTRPNSARGRGDRRTRPKLDRDRRGSARPAGSAGAARTIETIHGRPTTANLRPIRRSMRNSNGLGDLAGSARARRRDRRCAAFRRRWTIRRLAYVGRRRGASRAGDRRSARRRA